MDEDIEMIGENKYEVTCTSQYPNYELQCCTLMEKYTNGYNGIQSWSRERYGCDDVYEKRDSIKASVEPVKLDLTTDGNDENVCKVVITSNLEETAGMKSHFMCVFRKSNEHLFFHSFFSHTDSINFVSSFSRMDYRDLYLQGT